MKLAGCALPLRLYRAAAIPLLATTALLTSPGQGDAQETDTIFNGQANYRVLARYGRTTKIDLSDYLAPSVTGVTFALSENCTNQSEYYTSISVADGKLVTVSNVAGHVHGGTEPETQCTVVGTNSDGDIENRRFDLYTVSDRAPLGLQPGAMSLAAARTTELELRMTLPFSGDHYVRLGWRDADASGRPKFGVVSGVASGSVLTLSGLEAGKRYEIRASLMTLQAYDLYRGTSAGPPLTLIAAVTPLAKWTNRLSSGGLGKGLTFMASTATEDDDPSVTVTYDPAVYRVNEGESVPVTVRLSADPEREVTVPIVVGGGTAASSDYVGLPTTVTFVAGDTVETFTITATQDTSYEPDETVLLGFGTLPDGVGEGSPPTALVTIADDDVPSLTIGDAASVVEGTPNARSVFTVTLSPASSQQVTVAYATANGSATAGTDYTETAGTLTFAAGETAKTVPVTVLDDALSEPSETFAMMLSLATGGATIANDKGSATIVDDDYPLVTVTYDPAVYRVNEGESVSVTVRLSADPEREVTVPIAVGGGTATDSDYADVPAAVTFASGETAQTFTITATQDTLDELDETVLLGFGALPDGLGEGFAPSAIVTIADNDSPALPPRGWSTRFARTVTIHVMETLGERLRCSPDRRLGKTWPDRGHRWRCRPPRQGKSSLTLGGYRVESFEQDRTDRSRNSGIRGDRNVDLSQRVTVSDFLASSAFNLSPAEGEHDSGRWSLWGRGTFSNFEGLDSGFALGGDVVTGTLGLDYTGDAWLAGMALSHSEGEATYSGRGPESEIASSLTAFHPYLRFSVSERLSAWGAIGLGRGTMTWNSGDPGETDLGMLSGAVGVRGELVAPNGKDGFTLTVKADALFARLNSNGVAGLSEADTEVSRLRLGSEGSYDILFDNGRRLAPFVEAVLRHDGGDAERGSGVEVGGGVRLADLHTGLTMELDAHILLKHEGTDFKEWGVSTALRYDQDPSSSSGLTVALSLNSGVDRSLWARETMVGIAANDNHPPHGLVDAELGYRTAVGGRQGIGMPYAGFSLSRTDRHWRMGYRFDLAHSLTLDLQGTRHERVIGGNSAEHGIMLWGTVHW